MGATFVVQPLDLLKNRLQMTGEGGEKRMYKNTIDAFMKIGRAEGVIGMWNGISAGLLRQATYTTTRLGIFSTLQDKFVAREGRNPSLLVKVGSCLFVCLFVVVLLLLLWRHYTNYNILKGVKLPLCATCIDKSK